MDFLSSIFDAQNYAGITGLLARQQPAMGFPVQPGAPLPEPVASPDGPSPLDNAQWPFGPVGAPSTAEARLPANARETAGATPAAPLALAPPVPTAPKADDGNLFSGFRDKINDNSNMLLGLAAGLVSGRSWGDGLGKGFAMAMQGGQLDQKSGSRNLTEQALIKRGLDPSLAKAVASNPSLMSSVAGTLFKPQVRALTTQEKTTLGLPESAPWFIGADGKPFLPEQLSSFMPKHGVVGKDQFGNEMYGEYDPTKPAGARVTPDRPLTASAAVPSEIPEPPPGVNPKVWRDEQSRRRTAEAMPADPKTVSALRQEIQTLPSYKNFAQAIPVYRSMIDAVGRDNRASDVNLIYGMAKIMDPGSVVRESEMSVAQAIATIPQRLQAEVKSQIEATGRLSPNVRQALIEEARSRIDAYKTSFDQDAGLYRGIAERGRMDVRDVLPDFGELPTWQAPGATTKPKPGAYIWQPGQGMVPAK